LAYKDEMKKHLSAYKLNRLGVVANGKWEGKEYSHILPPKQKELNLLEPYRIDLADCLKREDIHLHPGFHHLTSSEAVCLNFFYPLVEEQQLPALLKILGLENEEIKESGFEKVINRLEGTNFDFYIELVSGKQLFFEIKYTEDGFKKEIPSANYKDKYENLYKERLAAILKPELDGYGTLMKNYQLLRNIPYVDATDQNILIIIYPEGNRKTRKEYEHVMKNVIESNIQPNVRLLTWETLCKGLMDELQSSVNTSVRLLNQYNDFSEKYLPF
jgi:hypothetical protein